MKQSFTIYRTIRIDIEYDSKKITDPIEAETIAAQKVVSDAQSHMYTVENGVQIIDITDCGNSI